jgi:hypothetical protein
LLLLRIAIGVTAAIQGVLYLADHGRQTAEIWLLGTLLSASGISLSIGLLTPIAGALVAAAALGIAFSWLPLSTPNLFNAAPLPATLVVVVAVAVVFLGPGSCSLDFRLFGRREIIIPLSSRPPRS